jgi:thioredoxin reductase (NADPH)
MSRPSRRAGPGQFLAELSQLSGRPALLDGHAAEDVETLVVSPEQLRSLIVARG